MSDTGDLVGAALLIGMLISAPTDVGADTRLTTTTTDSETGLNHTPICVDSQGRVHVVWAEQDGARGNYQIYERVRVNGVWQPSTLVVPFRPEFPGSLLGAKFPSLVCDENDTLHLVWHDYRVLGINNAEIFYKKSSDSAPWDTAIVTEVRLTSTNHPETNGDNGYVPTLGIDRNGTLHLTWYDFRYDGSAAEILYKSRVNGGWDLTPGDAPDVNVSMTAGDSQFPAMAVDGWGRVHLAWQDNDSGSNRILYCIRTIDGQFSTPEPLTEHALPAVTPALAVDGTGLLYAAWVDSRDGSRRIYSRRRDSNGVWSPERPATLPGLNADEPALAVDHFGQPHLAWHDTRVSALNREVFMQTAAAGADWDSTGAHDERVSDGAGHSTRPSLSADETGRLYVVWKDRRDGNNEIYFSEYNVSSPVAVGDEGLAAGLSLRLAAGPNPFESGTTLFLPSNRTTLTNSDVPPRLIIVSASGRRVREGAFSGDRFFWDGRDDAGRPVPAGMYFAGVSTNGPGLDTVRLVKTR